VLAALRLGISFGLLAIAAACTGQDGVLQENMPQVERKPSKAAVPTGTLRGTVYCADTNMPARLAEIYLLQFSQNSFGQRSVTVSDLDGRFALDHVHEGVYYVVAVLPGYVNLMDSLSKEVLDATPAEEQKKLFAQVPSVTISANQEAQIAIRLERGAEIDGTVSYDDGSAAIGLAVDYKLKATATDGGSPLAPMIGDQVYAENMPLMTDDHGQFRILGVAPGEYVVSVKVLAVSSDHPGGSDLAGIMEASIGVLNVYVGDGLRASKAETIKVEPGGASRDADITIPLSKLHTIRGQVLLKSSGQPPPAAAVQLLYADTRELARVAIAPNGEFEMHYVPEGSFILKATASPKPLPQINLGDDGDQGEMIGISGGFGIRLDPNAQEMAGGAEIPLQVTGDIEHVSVTVPDPLATRPEQAGGNEEQNATPATSGDSPQ